MNRGRFRRGVITTWGDRGNGMTKAESVGFVELWHIIERGRRHDIVP
jgi:hypothetical protein